MGSEAVKQFGISELTPGEVEAFGKPQRPPLIPKVWRELCGMGSTPRGISSQLRTHQISWTNLIWPGSSLLYNIAES